MINIYECPECSHDVEVNMNIQPSEVICNECKTKLKIEYDYDLIDGDWKDITQLCII